MSLEPPENTAEAATTLERHAEILAALLVTPAAGVASRLAALGLTEEQWERSKAHWKKAIEDDMETGDGSLVLRWSATLHQAKLELEAAALEAAAQKEIGIEPLPEPMLAPVKPEIPSYLIASPIAVNAISPTLPADNMPAAAITATPTLPLIDVGAKPKVSVTTQSMEAPKPPSSSALPFRAGSPVFAASLLGPSLPRKGPRLGSTAPLPKDRPNMNVAPLPFRSSGPPSAPTSASPASSGGNAVPSSLEVKSVVAPSSAEVKSAPPAISGATSEPARESAHTHALNIEQYASLRVELGLFPDRAGETRARYFVSDDGSLHALQASWASRFAKDPLLAARFESLCKQYREWLLRR